jgi:hypothetical protein
LRRRLIAGRTFLAARDGRQGRECDRKKGSENPPPPRTLKD